MKTLEEKIAVMQAYKNKDTLEVREIQNTGWIPYKQLFPDYSDEPMWNWAKYDYRIAPEKLTVYIYRNNTTNQYYVFDYDIGENYNPKFHDFVKKIEVEV